MGLDDLFGDYVPPQQEKELGPVPPPYEHIFGAPEDIPEEPPAPEEAAPDYDYDENIDYTIDDDDHVRMILDDLNIPNYESVDKSLAQDIMTNKRQKGILKI